MARIRNHSILVQHSSVRSEVASEMASTSAIIFTLIYLANNLAAGLTSKATEEESIQLKEVLKQVSYAKCDLIIVSGSAFDGETLPYGQDRNDLIVKAPISTQAMEGALSLLPVWTIFTKLWIRLQLVTMLLQCHASV